MPICRRRSAAGRACLGLAVSLGGLLAPLAGCTLLGRKGPVSDEVANCRQLSQQGIAATEAGRWEEAQRMFGRAVELNPADVEARRQYAETLWRLGSPVDAAAQLEQALQHDPEHVELRVRLGEMYLVMNNLERASAMADQALDLDINSGPAWALRGRLMLAQGDTDRALADFHQALRQMPNDKALLLDVAELYRRRSQPQRALTTLAHLAEVYPPGEEPQKVLFLMGLAYNELGRSDEAVESFYAASIRGQPTAELMFRLAESEARAGRPAAAKSNLRQALQLDPQHAPSLALHKQLDRPTPYAVQVLPRY